MERKFTIEVMVSPDGEIGYQTVLTSDQGGGPVHWIGVPVGINPDLEDIIEDGESEYLDSTVVGNYGSRTLDEIVQEVEEFIVQRRARMSAS